MPAAPIPPEIVKNQLSYNPGKTQAKSGSLEGRTVFVHKENKTIWSRVFSIFNFFSEQMRSAALSPFKSEVAPLVESSKPADINKRLAHLEQSLSGENVTLSLSNTINIQAMYFKATQERVDPSFQYEPVETPSEKGPTVLLFMGSDSSVFDESYESTITSYLERGMNVMVMDYPEVGKSTGSFSVQNIYAAANAAFAFIKKNKGVENNKILIEGFSMGSGPATYLAAQNQGVNLLLRNPFIRPSEVGKEKFKEQLKEQSTKRIANIFLKTFAPSCVKKTLQLALPFDNEKWMSKVSGPVALLTAGKDDMSNEKLKTQERLKEAFESSPAALKKKITFSDLPSSDPTVTHLTTYKESTTLSERLDTFLCKINFIRKREQ